MRSKKTEILTWPAEAAAAAPSPTCQWSLSNTEGPGLAWLPGWPVFIRRWELIILFQCSEPWQAAVQEGGRGWRRGTRWEGEEGHSGTHQKQQRARPDRGPGTCLSCCFLPLLLASWTFRSPLVPVSRLVNCSPLGHFSFFFFFKPHYFPPSSPLCATTCSCWGQCPYWLGFFHYNNKCKHGKGSFNRLQVWERFKWDARRARAGICQAANMQT